MGHVTVPPQHAAGSNDPDAVERPDFPTGYGVPESEEGLLPWRHAQARLEQAQIYWFATVRPDGRPHASPVWGVWLDNRLYFDGSPETRRVRNLLANPSAAVHLDSGGDGRDVVILEGRAVEVNRPRHALTRRIAAAYAGKYAASGYTPTPDAWDNGGLFMVRPHRVIAWTDLSKDPTRWIFGG